MAQVQTEIWFALHDNSVVAGTAEITYSYSAPIDRVEILGIHLVDGGRREVLPRCIASKVRAQAKAVALEHARKHRGAV